MIFFKYTKSEVVKEMYSYIYVHISALNVIDEIIMF